MSERIRFIPPTTESEDPKIYKRRDEDISCNKGNHKERSKGNDQRKKGHNWFWKKKESKKTKDDETQPDEGDTVTIGEKVYTFVEELTEVFGGPRSYIANEVLIGEDADETLQNLVDAINGATGEGVGPGENYSAGTEANPEVSAAAVATHATIMTARVAGVAGNAIAKSEDDGHLDWDGSGETFTGGGGKKAKYTIVKGGGLARRFITTLPNFTGTPTTAISLYTKDGTLIKALQATQAENSTQDTAYEVELAPGDYILATTTTTVSDAAAEAMTLQIR